MRDVRDQQEDAELKIASDVRNILKGKDVRETDTPKSSGAGTSSGTRTNQGRTNQVSLRTSRGSTKLGSNTRRSGNGSSVTGKSYAESNSMSPPPSGGQPKQKRGVAYSFTIYFFIAIFLLLIGNLVYFNVSDGKDEVMNSPYNKRQNSAAERIVRGDITTADNVLLATTETDENGDETRVYPQGNVYAHVVGFASNGKSGLESSANYELLTSHTNILDQVINGFREEKNPGDTLVTTLDSSLQEAAYSALGSYQGAVVCMNPATGEIKAMVSKPDYDPNEISEIWDELVNDSSNSQLVNRATQGLYAPGSTFKIVTALAYFQKYGTFENYQYNCTGSLSVGNTVVHCYKNAVHGNEDFSYAFAHSCNTSFGSIGLTIGADSLGDTAEQFLFGKAVPKVTATTANQFTMTDDAQDAEIVQTAFGQGQTLTNPYHMALIVSAIANNGVLMKPYLIDHIENNEGTIVSQESPASYKELLSLDESVALSELMRSVVTDGTASAMADDAYTAYGKTGSADYVQADGNIGTHSWFVGYGEYNDEKLVVAVIAEDGGAGSTTAVPMAESIFDTYFE